MARITDRLAIRIVDGHRQALEIGVFALAAVWHVGNDLPMLLTNRALYSSFALAAIAWSALTAIIGWAGWRLMTSPTPPRAALPLAAGVLVLGATVVAVCPPGHLVSMANWAFGTVGWIALLVTVRQPRHTVTFILLGAATTLVAVLWHRAVDQLPQFVIAGYAICALQIAVAAGARLVRTNAELGMEQARVAAEREIDRLCAEAALADRARRFLVVRPSTESLLVELAAGTLSPDRPEVRALCAMEAATLRRLCLEGNDVPHPLLLDLHELADVARRRGVRVELHATGEIGEVPDAVRAALSAAARAGSARARGLVRLTVLATSADLRLGGTADGPPPDPFGVPAAVTVRQGGGTDRCWWEATWTR